MGRIYTVSFAATVTAAGTDTDWLEVLPADDKPVKLRGMLISQISEVKDAEEEGLRFDIIRLPATVTSGNGAAATPAKTKRNDPAAGFTAKVNGTTIATTTGTLEALTQLGWNNRNSPYEMWFPDDRFAPDVIQGEALVVRMQTTLADDMSAVATFWLEEE